MKRAQLFAPFFIKMEIITSTQNQYVKQVRSLREKKFRDKTGLFVVEGGNIFKDMPEGLSVEFILATETRMDEVQKLLVYTRAQVYYISESVMESLSDTVTPYGIIAVLKKPQNEFSMPKGNALLLDGVSDPGNMGTIIRTAAARGFEDVYLLDCVDQKWSVQPLVDFSRSDFTLWTKLRRCLFLTTSTAQSLTLAVKT